MIGKTVTVTFLSKWILRSGGVQRIEKRGREGKRKDRREEILWSGGNEIIEWPFRVDLCFLTTKSTLHSKFFPIQWFPIFLFFLSSIVSLLFIFQHLYTFHFHIIYFPFLSVISLSLIILQQINGYIINTYREIIDWPTTHNTQHLTFSYLLS